MQRWRHFWGGFLLLAATLALALTLSGCGEDDLYASCNMDSSCGSDGDNVSCVEEQNLQCETQICARYKGSDGFCTTTCQSDGDCVAGKCREFVLGSETSYCVEDSDV